MRKREGGGREKTPRHKFFNENKRKEQNVPGHFYAATTFQFSSEGLFSNRGRPKEILKILSPLQIQILNCASSPHESLTSLVRSGEKKKEVVVLSPLRGGIIVAWKFINRDNKQDPANHPLLLFFRFPSRMKYRLLYLQFSNKKKKNWLRKEFRWRRSWSNFVDRTRAVLVRGIRFVEWKKEGESERERERKISFLRNYF